MCYCTSRERSGGGDRVLSLVLLPLLQQGWRVDRAKECVDLVLPWVAHCPLEVTGITSVESNRPSFLDVLDVRCSLNFDGRQKAKGCAFHLLLNSPQHSHCGMIFQIASWQCLSFLSIHPDTTDLMGSSSIAGSLAQDKPTAVYRLSGRYLHLQLGQLERNSCLSARTM